MLIKSVARYKVTLIIYPYWILNAEQRAAFKKYLSSYNLSILDFKKTNIKVGYSIPIPYNLSILDFKNLVVCSEFIHDSAYNLSILDFKFKTDNNYDTVISSYNLSILDFKFGI